jgi:hypothetical protein
MTFTHFMEFAGLDGFKKLDNPPIDRERRGMATTHRMAAVQAPQPGPSGSSSIPRNLAEELRAKVGQHFSKSGTVCESTMEVEVIVKACSRLKIPIIPLGAGTWSGLTRGRRRQ